MNTESIVFLFTIQVVVFLLLFFAHIYARNTRFCHRFLLDFVFYISYYKVFMYGVLPLIIGVYSGFLYIELEKINSYNFIKIYVIELISWFMWCCTLGFIAKLYKNKNSGIELRQFAERYKNVLLLYVVWELLKLFDVNNAILNVYKHMFDYGSGVASVILIVLGFFYWGKIYSVVGVIGLLCNFSHYQSRGIIVYLALVSIYLVYVFSYNKLKCVAGIVGAFLLVVGVSYYQRGLPVIIFLPETGELFDFEFNTDKIEDRSWIEEVEMRFGASYRMSTAYVEMYEDGYSAGWRVIGNTAKGFLPRAIDPDKPHPNAFYADDMFSQGMYIIYNEIHGYFHWSMVEHTSGPHAYWEFGWFGVCVQGALAGIYTGLCMAKFQRLGIISIPLIFLTFKPFVCVETKVWLSEIILQVYQIIIPLLLLLIIIYFFKTISIKLQKNKYD